jgi:cytochrome oxidase Cu insertion factor (SCO1/SenC/PrrC family)
MKRRALAALLLLGLAAAAHSDRRVAPGARPNEDFYLYDPVASAQLIDASGRHVELSTLWRRRPLLVVLVFAGCAEICPPYLSSLKRAVRAVGGAGERYDVVVVSFDPRDEPADMAAVAERHGLDSAPGWTFAVTTEAEAERLARSIGFWVRWEEERKRADHPAMLAGIDDGRVVRLLVGATVQPRRLREVVWELSHEVVSTYPLPSDKVLFRCFGYDPKAGRVSLDWGLLLLLVPAGFMTLSTLWIFRKSPHLPDPPLPTHPAAPPGRGGGR